VERAGVVLHQAGRPEDALASYGRRWRWTPSNALAWNNLGVSRRTGRRGSAIEAFRTRCGSGTFSAARLNLALLLFSAAALPAGARGVPSRALQRAQLRCRVERRGTGAGGASSAFRRRANASWRVEGDPDHAGAHYNLSFTLSNLGDFDAPCEHQAALELDPYYVSQKFALTIDLQYEKGTIGIAPEISADVAAEKIGEDFNFDQRLLDNIFQELAPRPPRTAGR